VTPLPQLPASRIAHAALLLAGLGALLTTGASRPLATEAAVVCVTNLEDPGNSRQGSGFVVHSTDRTALIVTLIHVAAGSPRLTVTFGHDRFNPVAASIVRVEQDVEDGFVLLRVEHRAARSLPAVTLGRGVDELEKGASLQVLGCPVSSQVDVPQSECHLRGVAGSDLELEGNIGQGNSGGPVFHRGALVGVVYQARNRIATAFRSDRLAVLLDGWDVDYLATTVAAREVALLPVSSAVSIAPAMEERLRTAIRRDLETLLLDLGFTPRWLTDDEQSTIPLARLEPRLISAARTITTNPLTGTAQYNDRVELQVIWSDDQGQRMTVPGVYSHRSLSDPGEDSGLLRAAGGAVEAIGGKLREALGRNRKETK
jgi:hypothetical protein